MNSEQKRTIRSTILKCREILEDDIEQVLINLGIYADKDWISVRDLENLTEEEEKNRENIEKVIDKLQKGGLDEEKSVREYIKEVSYTYLNRLAALRVMEVRGLIDEILISKDEYGNKSFIGSRFYEVAREYCRYEVDEGLSFLLEIMFEEISEEIQILFNIDDEYSFIRPSSRNLLKVIDTLCEDINDNLWRQDEIIGWIYQYFISIEKSEIFNRENQRDFYISVDEVPATTQIFTPDWVVDWILDNSLNKLYTEIKTGLRNKKSVKDIKLLDPCCGSGHFLVKAYDLFYEMYIEEGIYSKEEIPFMILENNIYGIDIDLRAVQLTGLILYIKTKTYLKNDGYQMNTSGDLSVNIVCADAILLNGNRLKELKEKHEEDKVILEMIEIIYEEFKDIRLKGSLIQPEKKLYPLFKEFKNKTMKKELQRSKNIKNKQTKGQEKLLDDEPILLEEYKLQRDFNVEEKELMDSLNIIYKEAVKANDISRQLFATEATKSMKLVNIFMQKEGYDIVVTNPPYMGNSNMDTTLKNFVMKNYKEGSSDLYSTFIIRCEEFLNPDGIMGMIVQHGFMYTTSYAGLRENILENNQIEKCVHLGTGIFEELTGEKVNSVMFTLSKNKQKNYKSEFIDISKCKNRADYPEINEEIEKHYINQEKFKIIKGSPFIYKLSEKTINYFLDSNYKEFAHVQRGLSTYNNDKYIRYYWEVKDIERWKWISKVSGNDRYVSLDNIVVDMSESAVSFYRDKGGFTGWKYYDKEGIYYPRSPYKANFSAKYLHADTIIEDGKPGIFPKNNVDLYFLLGLMNSNIIIFFLKNINPTNNCQVGDINRLPIKEFNLEDINVIKELVIENIEKLRYKFSFTEISRYFNFENITELFSNSVRKFIIDSLVLKDKIELEVYNNDKIINTLVYKTYDMNEEEIEFIEEENGLVENIDLSQSEYIKLIDEDNELNYDLVSYNLNLRKDILIETRIKKQLYGNKAIKKELEDLISILIGIIFNRWGTNNSFEKNFIIPVGSSIYLEEDIIEQLYIVIEEYFGKENIDNILEEIEEILDTSFERYIIDNFFQIHSTNYKRRPIYWHVCSPKKTFNCFLYYPELNSDTLYKVKGIYLNRMINRYKEDLKYYTNALIQARIDEDKNKEKEFKGRCTDLEEKLEDLNILDNNIMKILPYNPNIDEGVLKNIIPIESILSRTISTKREREKYYEEVKNQ